MPKSVQIINRRDIYKQSFFRLEEVELQHERYDGNLSPVLKRVVFERRDSVAALLHDAADDTIILIEQFRFPTYDNGSGWLRELPAGVVEEGEDPQVTMKRELIEETGYQAKALHHIHTFYASPGASSERIHVYYALVQADSKRSAGGGLFHEGEDIQTMVVKVDDALKMLQEGKLNDSKTIIALQWMQINRANLPK